MSQSTDRPANDPERAADTIPGGVRRDDARISAGETQSTGGAPDERGQPAQEPGGHRGGGRADDDDIREAGADR